MNRILTTLLLVALAAFLLVGCDNDTSNEIAEPGGNGGGGGGGQTTELTCLGCHSSEEMLVAALGDESGSKVEVPNKGDG